MGKKTSVYLSDELAGRVQASGMAPAELIRRGLDAGQPEPLEAVVKRAVRSALDEWSGLPKPPPARTHALTCKCGVCKPAGGKQG